MKLELEFNNLAKSPVKVAFVTSVVKNTLKEAAGDKIKSKKIALSFAVVSEEEIKKSNKIYRRKNKPTDILTFAEFKNSRQLERALIREKEVFLGEAILCYNDIEKYCQKNKKDSKRELATVVAHGVLHMLGLRHGKKMFDMQKRAADIY